MTIKEFDIQLALGTLQIEFGLIPPKNDGRLHYGEGCYRKIIFDGETFSNTNGHVWVDSLQMSYGFLYDVYNPDNSGPNPTVEFNYPVRYEVAKGDYDDC